MILQSHLRVATFQITLQVALVLIPGISVAAAQNASPSNHEHTLATGQVNIRMEIKPATSHRSRKALPPAVVWLEPLDAEVKQTLPEPKRTGFTLQQKNKMFSPHLLVVPVGSIVSFPNADPFFHNVFSLFDGKRFDLGLYEAGSMREVHFNREGISYIFCNIHPEMSSVVLALDTPFWAQSSSNGTFSLTRVPTGEYEFHIWVEGESAKTLEHYVRRFQVAPGTNSPDVLQLPEENLAPTHTNEFGKPYVTSTPAY